MPDSKRIVIVGAGISGLTAGIYAAKSGFKVEVYEKNSVAGGECTGWDKKGYYIDNCIRRMQGTKKGTEINNIWVTTGALDDVKVINSDKMYTSEFNGEQVTLWRDIDRTEKELIKLSPEDEAEIKNLMLAVRLAGKYETPANKPTELMGMTDRIKAVKGSKEIFRISNAYSGLDIEDLTNKFKHPLIKRMITDLCPSGAAAYTFLITYGNFAYGDYGIPKGGSRAMAERMLDKLQKLGGKVYTDSPVEKVETNDSGKAAGIRLKGGNRITADYVICACDAEFTFSQLLDEKYMDPVLNEVLKYRETYPVTNLFQAAFEVDSDEDLIGGEIITDASDIKFADWVYDRITFNSYSYEPQFAPKKKQIIEASLELSEQSFDYWQELYSDKDNYNKKKREYALRIMRKLEERFPEYKGKVSILDVWTPMTYKINFNAYKGSSRSYTMTKDSMKSPYISPYVDGLDNVILAGQWINPPGGLASAAITGKFAVQRILKKERKKVNI